MSAFIAIGRVLFAVIFIVSGALKLFDLAATAQDIGAKIVIPALATPYVEQIKAFTGMEINQLLAILTGGLELICGLMIAFNLAARFFALVLVLFVAAATYYYHDFWNQSGVEASNNMVHALKNLSIVGALLMIAGQGRRQRPPDNAYGGL